MADRLLTVDERVQVERTYDFLRSELGFDAHRAHRLAGLLVRCACSCCKEQVNLILHGRRASHCSCSDHAESERCDCGYCRAVSKHQEDGR